MSLKSSYGDYESLLFSRGFLCYPADVNVSLVIRLGWDVEEFSGWRIAHASNLAYAGTRHAGGSVAILGWASSTVLRTTDLQHICDWLGEALADRRALQDRVDSLLGRFVILWQNAGHLHIQHDALGLRGVYYTDGGHAPVAGSHAQLVGEAVGASASAWSRKTFTEETNIRSAPGRATARNGVLTLTPNTRVDLTNRLVTRLFPTRARAAEPARFQETLESVITTTQRHLDNLLADRTDVVASLSAGYDSRLTLALSRHHASRISWFTYEFPDKAPTPADEHDLGAATRLASLVDLPHTVLSPTPADTPREFLSVLSANRFRAHSAPLAYTYLQDFPGDALHLRSSAYGVASAYYLANGFPDDPVTPRYRMELASWFKCTDLHVLDAFDDLSRTTGFGAVGKHGYDELDFHLWEYREGVWLQSTLAESDAAFDTGVLLGSREVLSLLLSLPRGVRASHQHFLWMIRESWPELLEVPINGKQHQAAAIDTMSWDPEAVATRKRPKPT